MTRDAALTEIRRQVDDIAARAIVDAVRTVRDRGVIVDPDVLAEQWEGSRETANLAVAAWLTSTSPTIH